MLLRERTSIDMGVYSEDSLARLAEVVSKTVADSQLRKEMGVRGQRMVDANGAQRIVDAITSLIA